MAWGVGGGGVRVWGLGYSLSFVLYSQRRWLRAVLPHTSGRWGYGWRIAVELQAIATARWTGGLVLGIWIHAYVGIWRRCISRVVVVAVS